MRFLIVAVIFSVLSGCALIESDAGKAMYIYRVTTPEGVTHEIELHNAKDIGLISATVRYGDIEVELIEEGVNASTAMGAIAEQNSMLMQKMIELVPTVR